MTEFVRGIVGAIVLAITAGSTALFLGLMAGVAYIAFEWIA